MKLTRLKITEGKEGTKEKSKIYVKLRDLMFKQLRDPFFFVIMSKMHDRIRDVGIYVSLTLQEEYD